jgi:hypothetical protein
MASATLILRDARTRVRLCGSACACALLRMRTASRFSPSHDVKQPRSSRSRGAFASGFASLLHSPRNEGWAERRETFGCSAEHPWGVHITRHARRLARRLASHDAGRSPLGARPWRFWAPGPRFSHRHPPSLTLRRASSKPAIAFATAGIASGSVTASSSHPGRNAWRATSRASRGERLRAVAAGRHASLRIQDRL